MHVTFLCLLSTVYTHAKLLILGWLLIISVTNPIIIIGNVTIALHSVIEYIVYKSVVFYIYVATVYN